MIRAHLASPTPPMIDPPHRGAHPGPAAPHDPALGQATPGHPAGPSSASSAPVPRPRPRGWRRALRLALLCFVALVVTLGAVEGAMRVFGMGVPARAPMSQTRLIRMTVPEDVAPGLWETLSPGGESSILYPGHGDVPDRTVRYSISAQGLRDREFAVPKPPWVVRIALVGDSVAYGTGVNAEDSLPKQLETRLRKALPGARIEILNCGVEATNTSQQVALARYRLLAFDPDLWLWCVTIPDASGKNIPRPPDWGELPAQRWITRLGLTSGRWESAGPQDPRRAAVMKVRGVSVLADTLCHMVYARLKGSVTVASYRRDWDPTSPGFGQVQSALTELAATPAGAAGRVRVALYPTLTTLNERYPFQGEAARLAAVCEGLELPFLHLIEPLMGLQAPSLHAHPHDRHPNAHCHGLVAEYWCAELVPVVREIARERQAALASGN